MPITDVELAPSDVAAVAFGLGAASLDLASGHKIFGLNNMIACLIATDILQVAPKLGLHAKRGCAIVALFWDLC